MYATFGTRQGIPLSGVVAAAVAGTLLVMAMSTPALAAAPTIISLDQFAEDDSAFFTGVCGFPVTAESGGHVIFHNPKSGAADMIVNWSINSWLHSENGSYHVVDVGPNMELTRGGTTYFTVTGRAVTFTTVIGRVEVNLDTFEVTYHGRLLGAEVFDPEPFAPICEALS